MKKLFPLYAAAFVIFVLIYVGAWLLYSNQFRNERLRIEDAVTINMYLADFFNVSK